MRNAPQLRGLILTALLVVGLAVAPGVASAALTVTGAGLDGATSVSTPPGGVMRAQVTTRITLPNLLWTSTRQRIGTSTTCVNTGDRFGLGPRTARFDLTAPGAPGEYDVGFAASGRPGCTGPTGREAVLQEAIRVTAPAPNPNLAAACGLDVMLVLDESGSIGSAGETGTVRAAARGFLDALAGTGSAVSIVDFNTTASQPVPYTTVTRTSIANTFAPYLRYGYRPSGWTNWEAAFQTVARANFAVGGPKADLVLFLTDGDPTAFNRPGRPPATGLTPGDVTALRRAAVAADVVKGQGSHVFALGVGAAVTSPASANRLTAVSGFEEFPDEQSDLGMADYSLVEDFDDLPAALRAFAVALCKSSVTVTKVVDEGDGVFRPDPGWDITADVTTTRGDYTWIQPPPPAPGPHTVTTDKDGVAAFQWEPDDPTASSSATLQEAPRPGYALVDWTCVTSSPGATDPRTTAGTGTQISTGSLGPSDYARCTLRNRVLPGTIEIEASASPQSAQAFAFTGSGPLGSFSLVDDGTGGSASAIFTDLAPGTYTVGEAVPSGWELSGITCSNPAVAISGTQVTIPLAPGGAVVCTYRDRRLDPPSPPPPPEPPVPPTPPPPPAPTPPPAPPVPPVVIASTQLSVAKITPRRARVGQRVPFALRVTNVGPSVARGVLVKDVPPAAMSLTGLRSSGALSLRVVRGDAIWVLGALAPGASRTVRGSVLLTSATPGVARNSFAATALNAGVVVGTVDTRVLAARRVIPAVTG